MLLHAQLHSSTQNTHALSTCTHFTLHMHAVQQKAVVKAMEWLTERKLPDVPAAPHQQDGFAFSKSVTPCGYSDLTFKLQENVPA